MKTHIPNRTQERDSARSKALSDRVRITERRMVRAFNAWMKARAAAERFGAQAEKRSAKRIGGELDIREIEPEPPLGQSDQVRQMLRNEGLSDLEAVYLSHPLSCACPTCSRLTA